VGGERARGLDAKYLNDALALRYGDAARKKVVMDWLIVMIAAIAIVITMNQLIRPREHPTRPRWDVSLTPTESNHSAPQLRELVRR
jgi:hypothetical protein